MITEANLITRYPMGQPTRGHWTDFAIAVLPALIVSGFTFGKQGVRDWLSSLNKWRVGAGPYLLAFLLWPALIVVGNALARLLGFSVPDAPYSLSWRLFWMFPLNLLCILFYGGGNEEPGWRGFAQPMLQKKYSPLVAGLILGVIWALWHVPLNLKRTKCGNLIPIYKTLPALMADSEFKDTNSKWLRRF